MIQVTLGTNTNRKKVNVDPNTTLRTVLEDNEVNYSTATVHMDGASLQPGDLDKSFADFGITESTYLIAVVKADNAQ
jgi:hypothetical protein